MSKYLNLIIKIITNYDVKMNVSMTLTVRHTAAPVTKPIPHHLETQSDHWCSTNQPSKKTGHLKYYSQTAWHGNFPVELECGSVISVEQAEKNQLQWV